VGIWEPQIPLYREVFEIPGLLADPVMMIGLPVIHGEDLPQDFAHPTLAGVLAAKGLSELRSLDLFDDQADLRWDLNRPVPAAEHDRYGTVIDLGTLEHVFDARVAIESCLRMVRPGGHYFLLTPVRGFFKHGFHVFHPAYPRLAMEQNGFEIRYRRFSTARGEPVSGPGDAAECLLWIVGRKTAPMDGFAVPQQPMYAEADDQSRSQPK
jgi:hypothetical protein